MVRLIYMISGDPNDLTHQYTTTHNATREPPLYVSVTVIEESLHTVTNYTVSSFYPALESNFPTNSPTHHF